jgi:hypothetical protein
MNRTSRLAEFGEYNVGRGLRCGNPRELHTVVYDNRWLVVAGTRPRRDGSLHFYLWTAWDPRRACLRPFGWFYLVPIAILVSLALTAFEYPFFQRGVGALVFVLSGALTGAVLMAVLGVKEQGSVVLWTMAEAVGGGVSGRSVASLFIWLRRLPRPKTPTPPAR